MSLFSNINNLKINLEEIGWNSKNQIEQTLETADNNGNGLTNSTTDTSNITRRLLKQVAYHNISRLDVSILIRLVTVSSSGLGPK